MRHEDARKIIRDQGGCGRITICPGLLGKEEHQVCILPIGHDLGAHEIGIAELAAEFDAARDKIGVLERTISKLDDHLADAKSKLLELRAQADQAYRERNRLVAALAKIIHHRNIVREMPCPQHSSPGRPATDCNCDTARAIRLVLNEGVGRWSAWLGKHPEGDVMWDPEWRTIVYLQTPHGQLSWHVHDADLPLFQFLESRETMPWDGHTTEEKYRRLELVR